MTPLGAPAAAGRIVPDGKLTEAAWQGQPQVILPNTGARIFLRHDKHSLYIAATRQALTDRKGKFLPWAKTIAGRDAEVWKDDAFEVFLSNTNGGPVVHLGLSASGARYDARAETDKAEDPAWNLDWQGGVVANNQGLTWELAVPLAALSQAGVKPKQLALNLMIDQSDTRGDAANYVGAEGRNWRLKTPTSEALHGLGSHGRKRCLNFAPLGLGSTPKFPKRRFTLKLHFAELDAQIRPGQRRFDIKLQGQTVLRNFDIVAEGGGAGIAVVKSFEHLQLSEMVEIEFTQAGKRRVPGSAPIISALELYDEAFAANRQTPSKDKP